MAKGKRHGGQQNRSKKSVNKAKNSKKRHVKKLREKRSVDEEYNEGKVIKRLKQEDNITKSHETDCSDSEDDPAPYQQLLGLLGIESGSDVNQLTEKWREDDSQGEEKKESDEEVEHDTEFKDKRKNNKAVKQMNDNKTTVIKQRKEKSHSDARHVANSGADIGETVVHESNYNGTENGDHSSGDNDSDDDDDIIDRNETETDDYRKKGGTFEESDDDNDDDIKTRQLKETEDPFAVHFGQDLEESAEKHLNDLKSWQVKTSKILSFGSVSEVIPSVKPLPSVRVNVNKETTFADLKLKERLLPGWEKINKSAGLEGLFTPLQRNLFRLINSYQDVFYSNRTFQNGDEIRRLYCLHALNHILKTCSRVTKNTAKIVQSWNDNKEIGDLRDQGLTRPKVLILVPFRDAALKMVEVMMQLICPGDGGQVMNKKRFYEEYREEEETDSFKDNRPEDFKLMFAGNIDDCFRIGISVSKKSVTLYAKFYSSDIIVASPLGLRTIIGNEGEKSYEYDFLSSIEVIILDQTDVFLMQNWEHIQHIFEHLHLQPKDSHDVDFSRVRMWCLNGWSKFYRQTLIFSSFVSPEMNSLFNRHCFNFAGKVKASLSDVPGSICQVVVQVPQAFHRFECSSFAEAADKRFNTFINEVLPVFKSSLMGHTAIFVPSYFDFVRLRNYFKREGMECAQISEYSQKKDIQRARTYFLQGKRPVLLFTERFYFFYRYRIKGIKNIIFYELPHYSAFYCEILNHMDTQQSLSDSQVNPVTCTVLYTKSNALRLAGVVGTSRCAHMLSSDQPVHMFVTGDDES